MNTGILNYKLPTFTGLLSHSRTEPPLLNDWNFGHSFAAKNAVDIQVRSGDYFVTLATVLDEIANKSESYATRAELEGIVSDLIYLQDEYTIKRNDASTSEDKN